MAQALAVCLCVLLLSSCGGDGTATRTLTPADFGTTRTVGLHELVVLELPENPSTGFTWRQSWTPETALGMTWEYQTSAAQTGGGGTRCFVYETLERGQATITVQYGRWWEGGDRDEPQTITLNVR